MKFVYVLGVLLAVHLAQGSRNLALPFSVRSLVQQAAWQCTGKGVSCRDCATLQTCSAANSEPEFIITCKDQYPTKPYCDPIKNECVAEKTACDAIPNGFICPNEGSYPDVTDCRRYISCSAKGEKGLLYNCLFNSVYNHSRTRCLTGSPCFTVTAACGGQYKAIAYAPDKSLIVICRGTDTPLLKTCPNKNFHFNPSIFDCKFQCPEEGNFGNPDHPNKYFVCAKNGTILQAFERTCSSGTIFDESLGNCVLSNSAQSTTTQSSTTTQPTATS